MILLIVFAYLLLYAFASFNPLPLVPNHGLYDQQTLADGAAQQEKATEAWVGNEEDIALHRLLANVAPGGYNVDDAVPGTVIASPSKEHPNYYFQWVRDAAITISTLVRIYSNSTITPEPPTSLLPILQSYVSLQPQLQRNNNPSGSFEPALLSLGEPKFRTDGTTFSSSWGRPQRDGPALRALAIMSFVRAFNSSHSDLWSDRSVREQTYGLLFAPRMPPKSIIKADLEYVSHHWESSGFDLWEEVQGIHFFTAMVQRRALREGASLARAFDDEGAATWYDTQAERMEQELLPRFWEEGREKARRDGTANPHILSTLDGYTGRSGLDCGLLLGALHGHARGAEEDNDYNEDDDFALYRPHSAPVLASLHALAADMSARHPINAHHQHILRHTSSSSSSSSSNSTRTLRGVGVGRYPEDRYDGYANPSRSGGHPWFLCTAAAAQTLYATARHLLRAGELRIDGNKEDADAALAFWRALLGEEGLRANATYAAAAAAAAAEEGKGGGEGAGVFEAAVEELLAAGDEFMGVVAEHANRETGALSEQFDGRTGFERGARDLTWSYGAFLEAAWERRALVGAMRLGS